MKTVLFLNHSEQHCGVYQYGKRVIDIIKKSDVYNFIYCEIKNEHEARHNINLQIGRAHV